MKQRSFTWSALAVGVLVRTRGGVVFFIIAMSLLTVVARAAPSGQLGILTADTLAGNNPATGSPWVAGNQYRFAFHTSASRTAQETDIGVYNAWAQDLANASTAYNIGADDGVTWKVIGSTHAVDARDNTSTNPDLFGNGHSMFLLDGSTLVANNYADLWDGAIQNPIGITETGALWTYWPWTGSEADGTAATGTGGSGNPLGSTGQVQQGKATDVTIWIWRIWIQDPPGTSLPMYALSDPLSIVDDTAGTVLILR